MSRGERVGAVEVAGGSPGLKSGKALYDWGFLAKGIAIVLVVAGHFQPTWAPVEWLRIVKIIYQFHIPAFFLVAGLFHDPTRSLGEILRRKVVRLAVPFFSVAALFLLVKWVSGLFVPLDRPVNLETVSALFLQPKVSFAPFLWFLMSLTVVFIAHPLLLLLFRRPWLVFLVALGIRIAPFREIPSVELLVNELPWFALGVALRPNIPWLMGRSLLLMGGTLAVFVLANLPFARAIVSPIGHGSTLLQGVSGGLFVVFLSMWWERSESPEIVFRWVRHCGEASMVVYILHTPFQSAVRILCAKSGIQAVAWGAVFVSTLVGVLCPLWLDRFLLVRFTAIRRVFLGGA